MNRSYDPRTGRPLEGEREALETLTDQELEVELYVAAAATGKRRVLRFELLRSELDRRRFERLLADIAS
jgi:hypothetical protein